MAFFFLTMIPTETRYKTHNDKLLAIVKKYEIWNHYQKDNKHKVFILMDHNNLHRLIDKKTLSTS